MAPPGRVELRTLPERLVDGSIGVHGRLCLGCPPRGAPRARDAGHRCRSRARAAPGGIAAVRSGAALSPSVVDGLSLVVVSTGSSCCDTWPSPAARAAPVARSSCGGLVERRGSPERIGAATLPAPCLLATRWLPCCVRGRANRYAGGRRVVLWGRRPKGGAPSFALSWLEVDPRPEDPQQVELHVPAHRDVAPAPRVSLRLLQFLHEHGDRSAAAARDVGDLAARATLAVRVTASPATVVRLQAVDAPILLLELDDDRGRHGG